MALTPDQDAFFRSRLGSGYDDFDAETRLTRLGGDGYEPGVVVEVLQQRLSDLSQKPDSYTVVGEYSESWAASIRTLETKLGEAIEEAAAAGQSVATVYIQAPAYAVPRSTALDTEEFLARGSRLPGGR